MRFTIFLICLLVLIISEVSYGAKNSTVRYRPRQKIVRTTSATSATTAAPSIIDSSSSSSSGTTTTTLIPKHHHHHPTILQQQQQLDKTVTYPKKVTTLKKRPTKSSVKKLADITDKFKDLPEDDLDFIKELDKQFKLHGGKIKIKVENENVTATAKDSKNAKRTIEGELGYGFSPNGYDYVPPRYMFYPYSQKDISKESPKYYLNGGKTDVSIEPSLSYELHSQTIIQNTPPQIDLPHPDEIQQHQQQQQHVEDEHSAQEPLMEHYGHDEQSQLQQHQSHQNYEEPVIVLRIPGPAKYATHLQTLLQQYLEIRASQYLRILEEADQRKQHQQLQQLHSEEEQHYQQHLEQHEQEHQQPQQVQHGYEHQMQYDHGLAVTPQPIEYPEIDSVYQHYKQRQQQQLNNQQEQQQEHEQQHQSQQQQHQPADDYFTPKHSSQQHYEQPVEQQEQHQQHSAAAAAAADDDHQHHQHAQFYYSHAQQYAQPEGPPANTYQNIFLVAMDSHMPQHPIATPVQYQEPPLTDYSQHESAYGQDEHSQHLQQEDSSSSSHALSISENSPRSSHTKVVFTSNSDKASSDYMQEYPLPSIKPNERHAPTSVPDYHQDYHQDYQSLGAVTHEHLQQQQQSEQHEQQQQVVSITQRPYNYHANAVKQHRTRQRSATVKDIDSGLQKIRQYVKEKLGAETGTAIEFKTTEIVAG